MSDFTKSEAGKDREMNTSGEQSRMNLDKSLHGLREFYALLDECRVIHNKKSQDYASDADPVGNYRFAGEVARLFNDPADIGFAGRIAEKIYRLGNLQRNRFDQPVNESIEDTETDICVITALWMASRREKRMKNQVQNAQNNSLTTDQLVRERYEKEREQGYQSKTILPTFRANLND